MRRDPLARAMRPDKVTLAAVAATLGLYRAGRAETEVPVWQMIAAPVAEIEARARGLGASLGSRVEAVPTRATVGGGSLPGETLPSFGVAIGGGRAQRTLDRLRTGWPSIVGRIEAGRVILDLRTVPSARDPELSDAIAAVVGRP